MTKLSETVIRDLAYQFVVADGDVDRVQILLQLGHQVQHGEVLVIPAHYELFADVLREDYGPHFLTCFRRLTEELPRLPVNQTA